jgi:uncharacterized protein (TIGR00369 family)
MTAEEQQTRTYHWHRLQAPPSDLGQRSGLDFLIETIQQKGHRPPIGQTLDFQLDTVSEGRAEFVCVPSEIHYNPHGTVHGGLFGTLLDSAMGCAVHTTMRPGETYTTLEYKVNIVRPMTAKTGEVRAEGWVVHRGSRTSTAEGRIVDAKGKIYAHGTTTCIILPLPDALPDARPDTQKDNPA